MVNNQEVLSSYLHNDPHDTVTIHEIARWIEEADARIVPHVYWAVNQGCKKVVVLSNDTDTVAILLHYIPDCVDRGLKELWFQFGTREKRRMLPLHEFYINQVARRCKVIIKAHILTGDYYMSKIGSKLTSLQSDPVKYLSNFAESDILSEQDIVHAEEYLVRVWASVKSKTTACTFDQLRLEIYTRSATTKGIDALPPTSSVIRGHIHRAYT